MLLQRFIYSGVVLLLAVNALNATQIQVGSGQKGVNGLTAAYMSNGCIGSQLSQASFNGCVASSAGTFSERQYSQTLWGGAAASANLPDGNPTGQQLTDTHNGVTFAMVNESAVGGNNYWQGTGAVGAPSEIVIPIGVFAVSKVWMMLNDYWGMTGTNNTSVSFDFSASSKGAATNTITFDLINGVQIRSATDCLTPNPGNSKINAAGANVNCGSFATTTTSANTTNAFSTSYSSYSIATSPLFGTNGNLVLDDLAFATGIGSSLWLTDIRVRNNNGGLFQSRTALSAITLQAPDAVPEPASIAMMLGGLGTLGLIVRRRAKRS